MKFLGIKKIDRYIIGKFLGTYFYAIVLIISIAVVFDFAEKIDDFMEKDAPLSAIIFDYYLNFIPFFANLFSSLFTFVAVIFFTSKMAGNTEIIAILSSGVSFRRLLYPFFISAFLIATLSACLSNIIIPPANQKRLDFEEQYVKNTYRNKEENIHKQIMPGVFIYMERFHTGSNSGYKFSMEKMVDGQLVSKLMSDRIKWDSTKNKWTVKNYYIRSIVDGEEVIEKGRSIDTTLNTITPDDFRRRDNHAEKMNYWELRDFIEQQKLQGASNIKKWQIEKHIRFAYPFSTFILTLIAVSLSSRKVRGGIGMHIGFGVLLSFTYIVFMRFSTIFAIEGTLSPFWASWLPNFLFTIIGVYLYRLAPK